VLGSEEKEARSVNVRNRDDQASQKKGELIALDDVISKLKSLRDERRLVNKL
jgi:threonyl-tRNA synthetase